jgi:hypothetical protein
LRAIFARRCAALSRLAPPGGVAPMARLLLPASARVRVIARDGASNASGAKRACEPLTDTEAA